MSHTGKIVIPNHLQEETRFREAQFLETTGQGVVPSSDMIARGRRGICRSACWKSTAPTRQFDLADARYLLDGVAGRLGVAIERQRDAELQYYTSTTSHADTRDEATGQRTVSHRWWGWLSRPGPQRPTEGVQNALKDAGIGITTIER